MQTEAEKYLIYILQRILLAWKNLPQKIQLINLGAAKSKVIEEALLNGEPASKAIFTCDRVDIEDCHLNEPYVEKTYISALEDLSMLEANHHDVAFANFVLEHLSKPDLAARAIMNIMKPGGELILSLSNPLAPEFILAKLTPTSFHQWFRAKGHDEAYPVKYAYRSIPKFISIMKEAGWQLVEKKCFPATYSYLHRFPVINKLSYFYDLFLIKIKLCALMGHTVLHFKK